MELSRVRDAIKTRTTAKGSYKHNLFRIIEKVITHMA